MTEEAAGPREPATTDSGQPPSGDAPANAGPAARTDTEPDSGSTAPPGSAAPATPDPGKPTTSAPGGSTTSAPGGSTTGTYPPPGGTAWTQPPPPGGYGPSAGPPGAAGGFAQRYGLVRPQQGRYLAGVCAAIGRATNTDPVLWRVLLAVLGFFGGIGVLVYLTAWLVTPAEGDTASPVESMLGRGRSSMSPTTVIALGVLVTIMFGFIVTDGFRAVLLGAAVLIGGALLLSRNNTSNPAGAAGSPPYQPPTPPPAPSPPDAGHPATSYGPTAPPTAAFASGTPTAGPPPSPYHAEPPVAATSPQPGPSAPGTQPAAYREPFAPGGPYAGGHRYPPGPYPPGRAPQPPRPPKPARQPKPPRERSALGAVTFSMIFVVLGGVAVLDLADVFPIGVSTYFVAVLLTIGLGLLVGTWFGRARWLIALGLVTALALGVATLAESAADQIRFEDRVWRPASYEQLATRYSTTFGDATLHLTSVDFTGRNSEVTARVDFGTLTVVVPPQVDVTVIADVRAGDARIFDEYWSGAGMSPREVTDLGVDGPGGGTLRLYVKVKAGDAEVRRS